MPLPKGEEQILIFLDFSSRSDEERERDGTAALTAGAIGRGAAVPLPFISGTLSRNVRNADELAYQIAATVASGLVQVRCQPACDAARQCVTRSCDLVTMRMLCSRGAPGVVCMAAAQFNSHDFLLISAKIQRLASRSASYAALMRLGAF